MPSFRTAVTFVQRVIADQARFHDLHYTFSKTGSSIALQAGMDISTLA